MGLIVNSNEECAKRAVRFIDFSNVHRIFQGKNIDPENDELGRSYLVFSYECVIGYFQENVGWTVTDASEYKMLHGRDIITKRHIFLLQDAIAPNSHS